MANSASKTISIRIDLQEGDYKAKMKSLRSEMKALDASMEETKSRFIGQQNTLAAITARIGDYKNKLANLNSQYAATREANDKLTRALEADGAEVDALTKKIDGQRRSIEMYNTTIENKKRRQEELLPLIDAEKAKMDSVSQALNTLRTLYIIGNISEEQYAEGQKNLTQTFNGAQKALNALEKEYKKNETTIKRSNSSVATLVRKIEEEKKRVRELNTEIYDGNIRVNEHNAVLSKLQATINNILVILAQLAEAERLASASIDGTTDKIDENTGAFVENNDAAEALADTLAFQLVQKGFEVVKEAITQSITAFKEYETALAGVRKTTGIDKEELEQFGDQFRALSTIIPVSSTELLNIAQIAGQLGVHGTDDLTKFTETMAKLSVSTNMSAEEVATALAQLASVTGMSSGDYDKLGSAIVALGNNFATTEDVIVRIAQRFAGAATNADLSESAIVALAAASASVGIQAESAGTSLTKLVQKMQDAVTTGDKLDKWASVANMTSEEFARLWGTDSPKAIAAFLDGVGQLGEAATPAIRTLGIGEARLTDLINRLGNAEAKTGLVTRAVEMSTEAFEKNVALENESAAAFDTLASKTDMYNSAVNNLKISVGEQLAPQLEAAMEVGADLAQLAQDAVDGCPALITALEVITALFGVLAIKAMPAAFPVIGQITEGFGRLAGLMGTQLATTLGATATSFLSVAGAIGAAVAAFIILASVIAHYSEESKEYQDELSDIISKHKYRDEIERDLIDTEKALSKAQAEYAAEVKRLGFATDATQEKVSSLQTKLNILRAAYNKLPRYVKDAVGSEEEFINSLTNVSNELSANAEAFQKNLDKVNDFSTSYKTTAADYLKELQQQQKWHEEYSKNRENLWNRDIDGVREWLLANDDGTEKAAEMLHVLAGETDEELSKIVQAWNDARTARVEDEASFLAYTDSYDAKLEEINSRTRSFVTRQKEHMKGLESDLKANLQDISASFNSWAKSIEDKKIVVQIVPQFGSPLDVLGKSTQYIMPNAQGIGYVPYDGYLSALHEGEMVLNRAEASAYRALENGLKNNKTTNNITLNVYGGKGQSADEIANVVMTKIQQATDRRTAVWA